MIEVLRLSHRIARDVRITSHVALTSRALGASKIYYSGQKDSSLETSISKITTEFGGPFEIEYIKDPIKLVKEKKKQDFVIAHLTAYGLPIQEQIKNIRQNKNILVIIGSEKVPPDYYKLADFNISISSQPHSEVSSLAIFLHEYFQGNELGKEFKNPKKKIIPQEKGKLIKNL